MSGPSLVHDMPRVAYVVDPRFPGGTSSAVAAELEAILNLAKIEVHAIETEMFSHRSVAPQLREVLLRLDIPLRWNSVEIAADIIVFQNPSCLKFQTEMLPRLIARHLIVVTHENFLRPGGAPAFDVSKCLSIIASNSLVLKRSLAPVSNYNRTTVREWVKRTSDLQCWAILPENWFNVCEFEMVKPTSAPKDRRGRLSRPGFEKFPSFDVMKVCFPETAQSNVILGADNFLHMAEVPGHWTLHPFRTLSVDQFFDQIDFFVYYTANTWRESFGRVIAEAIAAGKIVITDVQTAETFESAVIGADVEEVDKIIADYISDPARYRAEVESAQAKLNRFSPAAFRKLFTSVVQQDLRYAE